MWLFVVVVEFIDVFELVGLIFIIEEVCG